MLPAAQGDALLVVWGTNRSGIRCSSTPGHAQPTRALMTAQWRSTTAFVRSFVGRERTYTCAPGMAQCVAMGGEVVGG
jgi:hypothetical protein